MREGDEGGEGKREGGMTHVHWLRSSLFPVHHSYQLAVQITRRIVKLVIRTASDDSCGGGVGTLCDLL